MEFKSFKSLFISLNGRSHIIFTLGFCDKMDLNSWISKCNDESFRKVLLFPLIQLSKSFKFHPISPNQSHNNQTNNHKYLFNITFQNLEFWDVTLRRSCSAGETSLREGGNHHHRHHHRSSHQEGLNLHQYLHQHHTLSNPRSSLVSHLCTKTSDSYLWVGIVLIIPRS